MKKILYALILLFSISTNNLFSLSNKQMDTIGKFVRTDSTTWDMQTINNYLTQIENALPKAGPQAGGRLRTYKKKLVRGITAREALSQRAEIVVQTDQPAPRTTQNIVRQTVPPEPRTTRDVATQTESWLERTTRDVATQTEPWLEQGAPETSTIQPIPTTLPPQSQVVSTQPEITPTQPAATPTQPEITSIQTEVTPAQPAVTPIHSIAPETLSEQKKKQPAPGQPLPSLATSVESEAHAAGIEFWTE